MKARIINEEGDLVFDLIDVPMSDKRPAYTGGALDSKGDVGRGNPMKGKADAVVGVFAAQE